MILETIIVGALAVNCYLLGSPATHEAILIDPGDQPEKIMTVVKQKGLTVKYIILTHGHFDHAGAAKKIQEETGATVMVHEKDANLAKNIEVQAAMFRMHVPPGPKIDKTIKGGDIIKVGDIELLVIETPGHTQGGICLYLKKKHILFSGDTLFWGSIGRTDLPGGDFNTIKHSLKDKLAVLPDNTRVLCGHGDETTIGLEKQQNPYME